MKKRFSTMGASVLGAAFCASLVLPAQVLAADFSLIRAVPDDVFIVVAKEHNPKKDFLCDYWGEVFDTLKATGIGEDFMGLIGTAIGEDQMKEVNRLKDKAQRLIDGVNWDDLSSREFVFVQRMAKPDIKGGNISMGPPDLVFMFRGGKAVEQNHAALVAIFQGIIDEINTAADSQLFEIETSEVNGAKIAGCNFTASVPGAPPAELSITQREDVIIISLGDALRNQTIGLLAGDKSVKSLVNTARFKAAFTDLPAAEDEIVFFDMQKMLKPIHEIFAAAAKEGDKDVGEKVPFINRMLDLPGMIDYTATTTRTKGYSVYSDVRVALVKGAQDKPFYPVFGGKQSVTKAGDFAKYLPSETVSYQVASAIDMNAFYQFVEDSFKVLGEEGTMLWGEWEKFQETAQFDFKKEVLSWMDGGTTTVTLEGGAQVSITDVSDAKFAHAQVSRAVEFLSTKMGEMAQQNPMFAMIALRRVPLEHDTLKGFETIYSAMNPMPVGVWGTADGKLIFGTSIDAIEMCLNTAKGKHPGINKNKRLISEAIVPDKDFFSATLVDQRNMGKNMQAMIGMVSFASGMMPMFIPDPEPRAIIGKIAGMIAKLSPVAGKIDFYKSTSTCTTFDGKNFWTKMVTHYADPKTRKVASSQ